MAPPLGTVEFENLYTTIDHFFRPEMMLSIGNHDAPLVYLVLDAIPTAELPTIRHYIQSINDHAKIDYSPTTKKLMISYSSREHRYMANIGPEIMGLVSSNGNSFTGNNPAYEIIENGDCEIRLGGDKHSRQPDGGLCLLNSQFRTPFLVWEVLDSQPLEQMIEKISDYFSQSSGRIRIVIIIQLVRQSPPLNPTRKRQPNPTRGRGGGGGRRVPFRATIPSGRADNPVPPGEGSGPMLPQPPPPGKLVQGFYWVYKHGRNAAGTRVVQCPIECQEFYPTPPVDVLTLTWAEILKTVPAELATKSLDIPFTILHDRFRKIAGAVSAPPVEVGDSDPNDTWDLSQFPGIQTAADQSEMVPEAVASDGGTDGNSVGVAESSQGSATPRRSVRISRGGA